MRNATIFGAAVLSFFVTVAVRAAGPASAARRPNVVIVLTDDQGYGDMSCHGNTILHTPEMDRLHDQSIRLGEFHVDPTCSPTRSALLTGRYSTRVGVWHTVCGLELLAPGEKTMAEVFKAGGYRTAMFGKWHLGDNWPLRPGDRGFDHVLTFRGGGIGQTPDHWGNTDFNPVLLEDGKSVKTHGFCTDVFTDAAMKWIEANRDHPFFVYLPYNACHAPFMAPTKDVKPFLKKGVKRNLATFYGMVKNIDENLGRLRAKLDELKLADNTLLIFMTDNGSTVRAFNAGMRGIKGSEYEGGHRVPCFWYWPDGGLGAPRSIEDLTAHIDVLPTLIDLCGLPTPAGVEFDGEDLTPVLRNAGAKLAERSLFVEVNRREPLEPWTRSAVLRGTWRLVDGKELYDVSRDPGQKHDVAAEHPDEVAKLRADYQQWWAGLAGPLTRRIHIVIGGEENPTQLNEMDWHNEGRGLTNLPPWEQSHIEKGVKANGWWLIDVAKAGRYRFTLRHKPAEAKFVIAAKTARVKVGDAESSAAIPAGATAVEVTMDLPAGPARMQTWFEGKGEPWGAYYVEVERMGGE